jgi:purine-binding chemotaxis protein CheW
MTEENQLEPIPSNLAAAELLEDAEMAAQPLMGSQFCVFRAGRERFCLAVLEVEEVVDWPLVTRIPLAPAFLMGVFNLRGSIIPVVDIAVTEGRRPGLTPHSVVVAVLSGGSHTEDMHIGIAADEVVGTFPASQSSLLNHSPENLTYCRGMLQHEDRLALIVDLNRLVQCFPIPVI